MVGTTQSSTTGTVELLHRRLDGDADDHECRRILADAVTEAGGDGCGYEALAARQRRPICRGSYWAWFHQYSWAVYNAEDELPNDWYSLLANEVSSHSGRGIKLYSNRRDAEEAAADAFLRLPPTRQQQLLRGSP